MCNIILAIRFKDMNIILAHKKWKLFRYKRRMDSHVTKKMLLMMYFSENEIHYEKCIDTFLNL